MILGFSTKFPKGKEGLSGKPTLFVEKIWAGDEPEFSFKKELNKYFESDDNEGLKTFMKAHYPEWGGTFKTKKKIHTFRHDKNDRWQPDTDIHFNINVRTKNQFRFAPVIKCKSTQLVEIYWWTGCGEYPSVYIDGRVIIQDHFLELAQNDGFDTVEDFFAWFDTDFIGKIIHWTNKKY